jgi:hypothetical protein
MTKMTPHAAFLRAMEDRIKKRPFKTISAYKIRESRDNIVRRIDTLTEIISMLSTGETYPVPILLGGCTTEDKAIWLKHLPGNLAGLLGGNLIPAVQALNVEGVPDAVINSFVQSIKGKVLQLLKECDAMQADTNPSIRGEYTRMKAGHSEMLRICHDALVIADQAVALCDTHGV